LARMTMQDSGAIERYLESLKTADILSAEEEMDVSRSMGLGSLEARNRLVKANLRFVVSIARKYQGRGVSLADLVSAGNLGLIKAAERFDVSRGVRFISYAVWWIRLCIRRCLARERHLIRLPSSRVDVLVSISRVTDRLCQDKGADPDVDTVARELGTSVRMVEETLMFAQGVRSLEGWFDGPEGGYLLDTLSDGNTIPPDRSAIQDSTRGQIEMALTSLKKRQRDVVRMYYGLDDGERKTLQQIGDQLGLTRERIRQIKEDALMRLRSSRNRRLLEPLSDPSGDAL
jgi:RNA polymerase primary sigma factor